VYPDYTKLKVGNYWIYERLLIDTAGNETPYSNTGPTYDSCFVEKDTVMSGKTYFKFWRTNSIGIPYCSFLRDSLSYTVDQYGFIAFSSQDFSRVFRHYFVLGNPADTMAAITEQMADKNVPITVPAGTFVTDDFKQIWDMYPNYVGRFSPKVAHSRYAEHVGIVLNVLIYYIGEPYSAEQKLVRYHVQ
jgi:hypothetical protein